MKSNSRPKSGLATFRKKISEAEDAILAKDRKTTLVPISKSPFKKSELEETGEPVHGEPGDEDNHEEDELQVYVTEVPWSDLLLEIAMTTTFSSLTNGTPVLAASDVISYLSFFALVWWIWASQVAYNIRFRTSDWLHRLFVFLQILVFSVLAAFTNNFDIFNGLAPDKSQSVVAQLQLASFSTNADIAAAEYQEIHLSTLKARELSVVMALSRLLLLVQYVIALVHAPLEKVVPVTKSRFITISFFAKIQPNLLSFYVHIGTLALSFACYLTAYGVIGRDPNTVDQAIKLALWYLPLCFEIAAHYYAMRLPGRVRYLPEAISARTSTLFIIILGGGLDNITQGFQYIVGNVSLGSRGMGLIFSAVVIFVAQFTLYFTMTETGRELSNRRILSWFFFHYLYLSALTVTLQGVATLLQFSNIGDALQLPVLLVKEISIKLNETGHTVHLNDSDFSDLVHPLGTAGLALDSVISLVNDWVDIGVSENLTEAPYNAILSYSTAMIGVILQNFDAFPDQGSMLYERMEVLIQNYPDNTTVINGTAFREVVQEVFITNVTPALWFFAVGGSTLVCLAFLSLIKQWPRDKYEWGQICSRLLAGAGTISLSALDVHMQGSFINDDYTFNNSSIWMLANHSWILSPFAAILVLEQTVEYFLLYLAGRAYAMPRMTGFFDGMQVQFSPYVNRGGSSRMSMTLSTYDQPFDPYALYDPQKAATRNAKEESDYDPRSLDESEDSDEAPFVARQ